MRLRVLQTFYTSALCLAFVFANAGNAYAERGLQVFPENGRRAVARGAILGVLEYTNFDGRNADSPYLTNLFYVDRGSGRFYPIAKTTGFIKQIVLNDTRTLAALQIEDMRDGPDKIVIYRLFGDSREYCNIGELNLNVNAYVTIIYKSVSGCFEIASAYSNVPNNKLLGVDNPSLIERPVFKTELYEFNDKDRRFKLRNVYDNLIELTEADGPRSWVYFTDVPDRKTSGFIDAESKEPKRIFNSLLYSHHNAVIHDLEYYPKDPLGSLLLFPMSGGIIPHLGIVILESLKTIPIGTHIYAPIHYSWYDNCLVYLKRNGDRRKRYSIIVLNLNDCTSYTCYLPLGLKGSPILYSLF